MDNQENDNVWSEEEKREFEEWITSVLSDDKQEEVKKSINEMSLKTLAAVYFYCKSAVVFRLAEFFCLSFETVEKAFIICEQMKKDAERWSQFMASGEITVERQLYFLHLAYQLTYLSRNFDNQNDEDIRLEVDKAIIKINVLAQKGYALAQYWMGYFAEKDRDIPDEADEDKDPKERAIAWYRKAAEQGCAEAQKRLEIVAEQRQREIAAERKIFGKCTYCGGYFKGIFKKVCCSCGKPKDY